MRPDPDSRLNSWHATRQAEEAKRTAAHGTDAAPHEGDQSNGKVPEATPSCFRFVNDLLDEVRIWDTFRLITS